MRISEQINELATALSNFQSELEGAKKDSENPFFKRKYADLESIWTAIRPHLKPNGLSVTQTLSFIVEGNQLLTSLITTLMHTSGQWISGEMPLFVKSEDSQSQGSAISYARRYCLAAILGVYQTDDDATLAVASKQQSQATQDWEKLKRIGKENRWPEAYMRKWMDDAKKFGKSNADVYHDAMQKFSVPNPDLQEVKA